MTINPFNPQVLSNLIYEAPERARKTVKKTAREMGGIDERYLARQLNPNDSGAKLGIEDFVYLSAVTDLEALDYIEQAFGRVSVPIPNCKDTEDSHWFKHVAAISKEAGECISTLSGALADGNITPGS